MTEVLWLLVGSSLTALACGLGVFPVALLGTRVEQLRPLLTGFTAGLMSAAAVLGLLAPALSMSDPVPVVAGLFVGVAFLFLARGLLAARTPTSNRAAGMSRQRSLLVFLVLFVHSVPEGFAIGTAFASEREGLSLFIFVAIALQNVPEGTAVAIPMQESNISLWRQFWVAVGTSIPQPIGALIAYALVEVVSALLPLSFGFAAGAMLALVAVDLLPASLRSGQRGVGVAGIATGVILMVVLSIALGV